MSGSRTPASATARRWCGRRTGSAILPSAGKARYGVTGPKSSRRTIRSSTTTSVATVFRIGTTPSSPSMRSFATSRRSSTRSASIGSRSSGARKAARRRLPMRRVTRSGCLTSSSTARSRRAGERGQTAPSIELHEAMIALTRQGWAQDNPAIRQILTSLFLPDATLEEMGWFNDLQRISSSAENAARLLQSLGDVNVLDLLPGIAAPTLVLHCRDDCRRTLRARPADRQPHSGSKVRRAREPQPRPLAARSCLGDLRQRGAPISS